VSIFNTLFPAIETHMREKYGITPSSLNQMGYTPESPENYVIIVCVPTDADEARLRNSTLLFEIKNIIKELGFAKGNMKDIFMELASQESVDKYANGNLFYYLK